MASKAPFKALKAAMDAKDYEKAARLGVDFVERFPDHPVGSLYTALALYETGAYEESEKIYKQVLSSDPSRVQAYLGLTKIYEAKGNVDGFIETAEIAAKLLMDQYVIINFA